MSLNEAVYEQIRDSILDGTFALGAPLPRRRLGELFHMSLVPVAQALQRLETEGLVESLPRVGTRVRVPKPEDVRGHYMLREALRRMPDYRIDHAGTEQYESIGTINGYKHLPATFTPGDREGPPLAEVIETWQATLDAEPAPENLRGA